MKTFSDEWLDDIEDSYCFKIEGTAYFFTQTYMEFFSHVHRAKSDAQNLVF